MNYQLQIPAEYYAYRSSLDAVNQAATADIQLPPTVAALAINPPQAGGLWSLQGAGVNLSVYGALAEEDN